MKARLSDIAERAGVSTSTVSRVLNNRPGVSHQIRTQVLTAVDVLGYDRPSQLRRRSTSLVGLVLPELTNPFFPRLAREIEVILARAGIAPVLCSQTPDGVHEDAYVETLLAHQVSGIIFVSGVHALVGSDPRRYQRLIELGMPIVMVNGALPGVDAPFVSIDDVVSIDVAMTHLEQMGHRRIGLALGQDFYSPVVRRRAAFETWTSERLDLRPGEQPGDLVACTTYTVDGGALAARRLLERDVTAIVCGSDMMALGAIREARRQGLRVPQDVSVIGSDDSPMVPYVDPPLTTVRQPAEALAAQACGELLAQIEGREPNAGEMFCPPELVVRASTARPPA